MGSTYQDRTPLGELVETGQIYFWLLEFNTQDWVPARLLDNGMVLLLDNYQLFHLEEIRLVPSLPIIKPERVTH